jgi:hypothetical protein
MTERNFKKEISHSVYYDMENGNDTETIDYDSLISIITELCDRIEALENQREVPYNNVVNIMQEAAEEFKR